MSVELDPRWEWIELRRFGERDSEWIKGPCNHLDVVPVEGSDWLGVAIDGDSIRPILAHLCLTCDAQLPAEWRRP